MSSVWHLLVALITNNGWYKKGWQVTRRKNKILLLLPQEHEKEFLLKDLMTEGLLGGDRRLGEVCSKRVYRILMAQSGCIRTDDVENGADFFERQSWRVFPCMLTLSKKGCLHVNTKRVPFRCLIDFYIYDKFKYIINILY